MLAYPIIQKTLLKCKDNKFLNIKGRKKYLSLHTVPIMPSSWNLTAKINPLKKENSTYLKDFLTLFISEKGNNFDCVESELNPLKNLKIWHILCFFGYLFNEIFKF